MNPIPPALAPILFLLLLLLPFTSPNPNHEHPSLSPTYPTFLSLTTHCNLTQTQSPPQFTKLVLFIIDALRIDFLPTILTPQATPRLPFLESLIRSRGLALESRASLPTVTLPRLKALLSGTVPSFTDYIVNLNAYAFQTDNLLAQLRAAQHRLVFYGDDTWGKLFPPSDPHSDPHSDPTVQTDPIFTRMNLTSSFFVSDYTEVDTNVTYNVHKELAQLDRWDVMILHYLGVDHIGHSQGYHSTLYRSKLEEMDTVVREIYEKLESSREDALLIVTGDHGMTNEGNHGGNTRDESATPLVFLSTKAEHRQDPNNGPKTEKTQSRLQIDFTPTLAALFRLHLPTQSQGRLIPEVLQRFQEPPQLQLCGLFTNSIQIQHVIKKTKDNLSLFNSLKNILDSAMTSHWNWVLSGTSQSTETSQKHYQDAMENYQKFLEQVQEHFVIAKYANSQDSNTGILVLLIIGIFTVILGLFTFEWKNGESILFRLKIVRSSRNPGNSGGAILASLKWRLLSLGVILANIIAMASTNFMQNEGRFWNCIVIALFLALGLVSARSWNLWNILYSAILVGIFYVMINWRIIVLSTQWGDSEEGPSQDMYTYLAKPESRDLASVLFLGSLGAILGLVVGLKGSWVRVGLSCSALGCVYLYRSQTGSLTSPFTTPYFSANTYAQLVYAHALILFLHSFLPNSSPNSGPSPLESFQTSWIILSSLLLDPFTMPLLPLHVLLERTLHWLLSSNLSSQKVANQLFSRLVLYLTLGTASFYQIGNTNSLSTVNVNACFIGLSSYQLAPCTLFMIVSIYSTTVFWILTYFLRLQADLARSQGPHSNYRVFNSCLTCLLLIRLGVMVTNLCVTLALREHPYIWSVLSPKLLYELVALAVNLAVSLVLVGLFVPYFVKGQRESDRKRFL